VDIRFDRQLIGAYCPDPHFQDAYSLYASKIDKYQGGLSDFLSIWNAMTVRCIYAIQLDIIKE
jgi:hypothetical protein